MNADETHDGRLAESAKQLLSTHPVNSHRIANIEAWLPDAERIYQANHCSSLVQALQAMQSVGRGNNISTSASA